jgi:uncharacterized protein YodC (DUF2158 family)
MKTMENDFFTPGDVVRLKSGGPRMTVCRIKESDYSDETVVVEWFDKRDKVSHSSFCEAALERVEDESEAGAGAEAG